MMSYRGQDLDLRLPQGQKARGSSAYDESSHGTNGSGTRYRVKAHRPDRSTPLWVDDTVLAVCNAAYEVAQALNSPEVLLQHLLHGMTRVSGAQELLEERGVDLDDLRRDVTELISRTAARTPDSIVEPVTSSEFKAAMRLAGEAANRRGDDATTVQDLFDVLMNYDTDHPGVALLLDHVEGRSRKTIQPLDESLHSEYRYKEIEAPYSPRAKSNGTYWSRRYATPEILPLERVSRQETAAPAYMMAALEAMEERVVSRLVMLESNYREELRGFQSERQALTDLVGQLHADVAAHRNETLNLRDGVSDQFKAIERLAQTSGGRGENTAPIMARLQGVERLIESRLDDVGRRYVSFGDQIRAVEAAIGRQNKETVEIRQSVSSEVKRLGHMLDKFKEEFEGLESGDFDLGEAVEGALGARLDTIETLLLDRGTDAIEQSLSEDDMSRIEALFARQMERMPKPDVEVAELALSDEDIARLETAVAKQVSQITLPQVMEASLSDQDMARMEALFSGQVSRISMPDVIEAGISDEGLARIEAQLNAHHQQISASMADRERSWTAVNERLNKLEHMLQNQSETTRNAAGDRKRLLEAVNERLANMEKRALSETAVDHNAAAERKQLIDTLNARFAKLEQLSTQQLRSSSSSVESVKTYLSEIKMPGSEVMLDMKNSMARISGAQQTTAEVFDQWRQDMSNDLHTLNERLTQIERSSTRPVAMLDNISAELRNLHIATVEKTRKMQPDNWWESFSNWLFGPR